MTDKPKHNNLIECAFPVMETINGQVIPYSEGFSKHELATILIASKLAEQTHFNQWDNDHTSLLAKRSYELAKEILNLF